MPIAATVKPGLYKDSVALMRIGERVLTLVGVERATLLMGTPANKEMLDAAELRLPEVRDARPNDLMIVVEASSGAALDAANAEITRLLGGDMAIPAAPAHADAPPRSIAMAVAHGPQAQVAQISVPGAYAGAEAMKALHQGLHVFLFSDNVPLAQERALKALARRRGLLVMGPDCGTAILRGVPLGFANVVRRGSIGLAGASGTGLQQVMCGIHALGHGVSHAIGTGGRDMDASIGGATMRAAIDLLARDAATKVIAIVAKSPAPEAVAAVLEHAARSGKPCVALFLGADSSTRSWPQGVVRASTLEDAAAAAVALAQGEVPASADHRDDDRAQAQAEARRFASSQRFVRGLFSGGTFCTEARVVWREWDIAITPQGHDAVDLGADEFTVGRPHPMIDTATRVERILREARDPGVAVLLLDVVLGYGSHADPAGALGPAIEQAKALAANAGRHLAVVAFVCGTEDDPQRLSIQQARLRAAGAMTCGGSTSAARLAAAIVAVAAESRA